MEQMFVTSSFVLFTLLATCNMKSPRFFVPACLLFLLISLTNAFTLPSSHNKPRQSALYSGAGFAKSNSDGDDASTSQTSGSEQHQPPPKKKKGDSIRSATGIRPSLHPTTINCIAEALLMRSKQLGTLIVVYDMMYTDDRCPALRC